MTNLKMCLIVANSTRRTGVVNKGTTMAKVSRRPACNISPDQTWALIGTFNALPDWHPAIQSSRLEGEGRVGRLTLLGGGEIEERLETIEAKERFYRYRIVNRQLSVANYTATLRVCHDGAGQAVVDCSGEFEPDPGIPDNEAIKMVQDIYPAGLDKLKKCLPYNLLCN
jgi:Polyketide cyclase / dehydrase and lipid transport